MQGLAEIGRRCGDCGSDHGDTSGLCCMCRMRAFGLAKRKYFETPELVGALRKAYRGRRPAVTAALTRLQAETGWPRGRLRAMAVQYGFATVCRPWTAAEIEYLKEKAGTRPVWWIARKLGRAVDAARSQAVRLELSVRYREGYTLMDLRRCFGEDRLKVLAWVRRGLFGKVRDQRISEAAVERFVRTCWNEYDLRRVDQAWFKSVAFAGKKR